MFVYAVRILYSCSIRAICTWRQYLVLSPRIYEGMGRSCSLVFCQPCKTILVSISLEVQPIPYVRNARKWNFPFRWLVKGSFVIYFKRIGGRRRREEIAVKDLIVSARRLRNLPVCIWLALPQATDAVNPSSFEMALLSCIIQVSVSSLQSRS